MKLITINGIIGWDVSTRDIQIALEQAADEDIKVEISSPGGFVYPGLYIFNLLKNYSGKVHTHLMGLAASMASVIAMAGDKITAESNSVFMIHNASLVAMGDFRIMQKASSISEGISNMIAKTYAARTGKAVSEIQSLMNAETYFFGDESQKAGFVDEVYESKTKTTKEEAMAIAQASIMDCNAILKDPEKNGVEDIEKVAAMTTDIKPQKGAAQYTAIGAEDDDIQTKEHDTMDLNELMAKEPALHTQVEALKKSSFDDGVKAGLEKTQAKIKIATAYLASDVYPAAIKNLAVQVLNGEKEQAALDGAVTVYDAMKEAMKQETVMAEAGELPETPNAPDALSQDGTINNEADFQASIAWIKGM